MFKFLGNLFGTGGDTTTRVIVEQGKRGRYRLKLHDEDDNIVLISTVRGYETPEQALAVARKIEDSKWTYGPKRVS